MKDTFNLFCQLTKVDEEKRLVYGRAAAEEPDASREIFDYTTSKPNFEKWSQAAEKRTGGKSKGNVREMHNPVAAGKVIDITYEDTEKAVDVATYCSDDATWRKILDGTLSGFSIAGKYQKRWADTQNPSYIRYTALPQEISYVDSPAIPSAVFTLIKADGSEEIRKIATMPDIQPVEQETRGGEASAELVVTDETALNPVEIPVIGGSFVSPDVITDDSTSATTPETDPLQRVDTPLQDALKVLTETTQQLVTLLSQSKEQKESQELILKAIGLRVGIARRESEPLMKSEGYSSQADDYGDPANWSWALDTSARCQTAIADFNARKARSAYPEREWHILGRRIAGRASVVLGKRCAYNARLQEITMQQETHKMELNKMDVNALLSQVSEALNMAVDQLGQDPAAAKDLLISLLGSLDSSVNPTPVNTTTSSPTAPTGGAQGDGLGKQTAQPPMMSAEGVTPTGTSTPTALESPGSSSAPAMESAPDSYKALADSISTLTSTIGKLMERLSGAATPSTPSTPSVSKGEPMGDLGTMVLSTTEPDAVLKALAMGGRDALLKAAQAAGTADRPDFAAVDRKVDEAINSSLTPKFTRMMIGMMAQNPTPDMKTGTN